jgi:hypothetical protein
MDTRTRGDSGSFLAPASWRRAASPHDLRSFSPRASSGVGSKDPITPGGEVGGASASKQGESGRPWRWLGGFLVLLPFALLLALRLMVRSLSEPLYGVIALGVVVILALVAVTASLAKSSQ